MGTQSEDLPAENEANELETQKSPKKQSHRKRKKHHYNAIRAQMEFYFGDANLSKDRFLKQMIDKDPFVPIEVFLTFNKMKVLSTTAQEIATSLSNSELLELDETLTKVRRKTALPTERNVDEKTLYVEALPPSADHDWVRQIFERFGPVTYVSLPKYMKSRKIKEFGFVEFEQEGSVEKAVKAFKEFNGVLSMVETEPAELKSVKAFLKEQKQEEEDKNSRTEDKKPKKRQLDEDAAEEPGIKKIKTEEGEEEAHSAETETEAEGEGEGEKEGDNDDDSSSSGSAEETNDEDNANKSHDRQEGEEEESGSKKKRRKRKKKTKSAKKRRLETTLNTDASYYELKVLPKRDWKRLRNKYLNLQREKVAELKRKAWKEQQQAHQQAKDTATEQSEDANAPPPAKQAKPNERKFHKMNMNFYGAGDDEQQTKAGLKDVKQNLALERAPLFTYEPGLIVEVSFMEPCVNVKEFKADMRQYATVKYVDVKEGAIYAHLRLESAIAAEEFVRQINCAEYKCKALSGDTEAEYWKKIERDREMKLNKQVKVPQKRGREKVKKLVTKHIRFNDDDE